jgi:hypothetical protein
VVRSPVALANVLSDGFMTDLKKVQ